MADRELIESMARNVFNIKVMEVGDIPDFEELTAKCMQSRPDWCDKEIYINTIGAMVNRLRINYSNTLTNDEARYACWDIHSVTAIITEHFQVGKLKGIAPLVYPEIMKNMRAEKKFPDNTSDTIRIMKKVFGDMGVMYTLK